MSHCPACGNPVPSDADLRFCARCGKELAGAAVPPPPSAPPTVHVTAPGGPSPAALFLRRTATGRWDLAAAPAAVPALCFVVLALVIAVWSGAAVDDPGIGFADRARVALAALLTGVGAVLRLSTRYREYADSGSAFGDSSGAFGDADGTGLSDSPYATAHSTLSLIALAMTLLWAGSLALALRGTRNRLAGAGRSARAEAAVRVGLLAGAAALVLGLVAQPSAGDVHISTGPALLTLWALLISLATALLTLCAPEVRDWLAVRPGLAVGARALRTALLALLITVLLAGFVVFVVVGAHSDETTGWGVAFAALFLPNLGVSGLGLGWGAPFRLGEATPGGRDYHVSLGLGDLGHIWDGWAAVGAVAGGVVCALVIGVLAVKRSADRIEQFLVAGLFTALFVLLVAYGGASMDGSAGASLAGIEPVSGHSTYGTSVPEALMFALLWSCGGVLVAPFVWRALGGTVPPPMSRAQAAAAVPLLPRQQGPHPQQPPAAPPQGGPEQPGGPAESTVHDLGIVQPPRLNKPPDHR